MNAGSQKRRPIRRVSDLGDGLPFEPREERPLDFIKYGPWAGGQFANVVRRHMAMKMRFPDRKPTMVRPYGGIEGLRPETQELLRIFSMGMQK